MATNAQGQRDPTDALTRRIAMSTAKRESPRQPAGMEAQDSHAKTAASTPRPSEITDEQLGLLPADERDRVSDVIGPNRDDIELREDDDLRYVPGNTASGIDFAEAGRQAQAEIVADETDLTTTPHELAEGRGARVDVEPGWTDQPLLTDPAAAVGDSGDASDPASDLDQTYTPPTDPVVTSRESGDVAVLGGFGASSGEQVHPRRSSDGEIGDEALVDAVRSALRHDAATTDLRITVTAVQGVVKLRGRVPDLDDADNAEAVAANVEGVLEVQEQLEIANG